MTRMVEAPRVVVCVRGDALGGIDGNWSWCLRDVSADRHTFRGVDAAALNGRHGSAFVVCPECLKKIDRALRNGYQQLPADYSLKDQPHLYVEQRSA